jgi:hypothetical protein
VFLSARAAVDAAVDAQFRLGLPVRMGVGVGTGEAELRGEDYFGPALNGAARVMAAGHGGQVLVAASTAALVDGIELVDLGEHSVRDLSGVHLLFQVRAAAVRAEFPPLRTLDQNAGVGTAWRRQRPVRPPTRRRGNPCGRCSAVTHHEPMSMSQLDERRALAYLVSCDEHVKHWRQAGGPWRPFEGEVPVAAMKAAALGHPSAKVRREALGVLDHGANDESIEVFRAALSDPVPRVRLVALHGLSCERCRVGEICVEDVVPDVVDVLRDDANVKVRHAAIDVLCRFASRDDRVVAALRAAALEDPDPLVRAAADGAARGEHRVWSRKAVRRRQYRSTGDEVRPAHRTGVPMTPLPPAPVRRLSMDA